METFLESSKYRSKVARGLGRARCSRSCIREETTITSPSSMVIRESRVGIQGLSWARTGDREADKANSSTDKGLPHRRTQRHGTDPITLIVFIVRESKGK